MELAPLLTPVTPDDPCGPDLKGTLAYAELDRLAKGKPEQYVGDKLVAPAEEPAWRDVIRLATALLGQSKDLRIAVILTRGLLNTSSWAGLVDGLSLVHSLLAGFWDHVHPQLDREDNDDPTLRMNSLGELADEDTVLAPLRRQILVSAPRAGRFSLRDVQSALSGTANRDPAAKPVESSLIEAAFAEVDLEQLRKTAADVHAARQQVTAIELVVTEKLGGVRAVSLAKLTKLLQDTDKLMSDRVAARTPVAQDAGAGMGDVASGNGAGGFHSGVGGPTISGVIRSRDDVVRTLDLICDYYRDREPSSPVPLLLQRAKKLVSKSFFEIIEDLTPDGVSQLRVIRGKGDDE